MRDQPTAFSRYTPRARVIAKSAVEVLGNKGAAGLTHRAVDRHAGLPEGSTSNVFRTRNALLMAVCDCLTDTELEELRREAGKLPADPRASMENTAAAIVDIVQQWSEVNAVYTCARLELYLIARRNPHIADHLARARARFRDFTSCWMNTISPQGKPHLANLIAVVEGLTMSQLVHPKTRLSRAEMLEEISLVLRAITQS